MPHALTRKTFVQRAALALGGTLLASAVQAQAPVEVQFYYPVAVGGAIAKTMAFEKRIGFLSSSGFVQV